jgi:hypothetical protein
MAVNVSPGYVYSHFQSDKTDIKNDCPFIYLFALINSHLLSFIVILLSFSFMANNDNQMTI